MVADLPGRTTDFAKGVGSGPYKLTGSDAQTAQLTATGSHWSGQPTLKQLQISRIDDPAARLSGVKDGQLDYALQVSATGALAERADKALTSTEAARRTPTR